MLKTIPEEQAKDKEPVQVAGSSTPVNTNALANHGANEGENEALDQ